MANSGVTTAIDRVAAVMQGIRDLGDQRVMVGIPATKTDRSNDDNSGITNAALGYIHENGSPGAGIPARPFLIPGVASAQEKISEGLRSAAEAALEGRNAGMVQQLNRVGLIGQAAVRKKITDGPFVPLQPATLAARRRRGRTGTKPLIDTAQLRSAVSYVIRKK